CARKGGMYTDSVGLDPW
nr:immunoglobulin heavy chain junction region [Macaca mulatta]MOV42973.1 immunoglobulin heavy chain junction region [Macaca mulatta]